MLVSELVTNSIRHARIDREQPVRVQGSLRAEILRLEIWDAGTDGTVAPGRPRRGDDAGGFGLNLVALLARDWGVQRNAEGTTVWLELHTAAEATA